MIMQAPVLFVCIVNSLSSNIFRVYEKSQLTTFVIRISDNLGLKIPYDSLQTLILSSCFIAIA